MPIGRPIANTTAYVLDPGMRAGAGRGGRGAVPRRRGAGARVLAPAGADGGAVRARSVRGRAGRTAVPDRGPGAAPGGRSARVPGPRRPPGEGARVPDRARGDRGGASRGSPGFARRRWSCGRTGRGDARLVAYVVRREGEGGDVGSCVGSTCGASCRSYMVPAAFVALEALPLTPEREGGPARAAGAGGRRAKSGARTLEAPRGRGRARRSRGCGGRCWGSTQVGRRRQLLRPRRPLAAARAGARAPEAAVPRTRPADRRPLPLPDGRARWRSTCGPRRNSSVPRHGRASARAPAADARRSRSPSSGMAGRFPGRADIGELLGQPALGRRVA